MMSNSNGWSFRITPVRIALIIMALIAVGLIAVRLIFGLGVATNLNNDWPWGLWIAFDVLCGVALAGGGYATAFLVHVLHIKKFHPIARSAMITSLLGYLLVLAGLFLDVGRWFNAWRPFVSWGYHSVLFEVFWCVSLYTMVQVLEFGEIVTEKIGKRWHNFFKKILPVLIIVGVLLPTLHQSSLGSLYVMEVGKLHPLWWSMLLPVFFLMSSFFVGPAMVTLESFSASKSLGIEEETSVLQSLVKVSGYIMIVYLLLKIGDLLYRGSFGLIFNGSLEGNMFLLEIIAGVLIPIIICFSKYRYTKKGLVAFGALTAGGVVLNRMNVVFTGMSGYYTASYFPSIIEFAISLGLVCGGIIVYLFIVENFNILPGMQEKEKEEVVEKKGYSKTGARKTAIPHGK